MKLLLSFLILFNNFSQQAPNEIEIVGVYQGIPLFIQNQFLPESKQFCVTDILVNDQRLDIDYNLSALIVDFEGNDVFTPVKIKILSSDSLCLPVVVNPDAILFHTSYKFNDLILTDSIMTWETEGEREVGYYVVEKLNNGFWDELETIQGKGQFERTRYEYFPIMEEGPNKYRIKYDFGNGTYLYSDEVDYDHYPDPVTISPKVARRKIEFSRAASYEVYDPNSKLVLSGKGIDLDISGLFAGDYVIYFDGKDPVVFTKVE